VDITVIVCTFNRRESLSETLDTIETQRTTSLWDVLIVDNNSTDGTVAMVRDRAKIFPVPLRIVREGRQGIAFSRNRGIESAEGSIFLFTDDDVNCLPNWIEQHAIAFADRQVAGTSGRILPVLPRGTPSWYRELVATKNGGPSARYDFGDVSQAITKDSALELPFGANMAIRRSVAEEVGRFRTNLGWGNVTLLGEETEYMSRVRRLGHRLWYVPGAIVEHRIQDDRTSLAHYMSWHHGLGRYSIITQVRPYRGYRRVAKILKEFIRLLRFGIRASLSRSGTLRHVVAVKKLSRARGRLAQLFESNAS